MSANLPQSSPSRSTGSSPRRRPLHERSQSSTNEAVSPQSHTYNDYLVYTSDPFPQHPSQILQPNAQSFIYEDDTRTSGENLGVDFKSPSRSRENLTQSSSRSPRKKSSSSKLKGNGKKRRRRKSEIGVGGSPVPLDTPDLIPQPLSPDKSQPQLDDGQDSTYQADIAPSILPGERTKLDPLINFSYGGHSLPLESRYSPPVSPVPGDALIRDDRNRPPPANWPTLPMRQKGLERLHSKSSAISNLTAQSLRRSTEPHRVSDDPGERPRSASSPLEQTDAFLQSLIDDGVNVQYPVLKQPSATSLRSQSSSTRTAYPPPLRLHRKRANSHLSRAASGPVGQNSFQDTAYASGVRASASPEQPETISAINLNDLDEQYVQEASSRRSDQRASGRWTDEMDDTITELNPHPLRQQRSGLTARESSAPESRPTTSDSSSLSRNGSFYKFLNDSRTSWARVYYQQDRGLPLETPPRVTNQQPQILPSTPIAQRQRSTTFNTSSGSGPSRSPGSAEFPDAIYVQRTRPLRRQSPSPSPEDALDSLQIPRIRPLQNPPHTHNDDDEIYYIPRQVHRQLSADSLAIEPVEAPDSSTNNHPTESSTLAIANRSPDSPTFAEESQRPRHKRFIWNEPFNPTQMVPHLSPDKRTSVLFTLEPPRNYDAPSFDEQQSAFSRTNRQIVLFCIGFVLPFAWWVAAVLPIPPRPGWRKSMGGKTTPVDEIEEKTGRGVVDLFNSLDVQRWSRAKWWRNLNRFMSVIGLIVIATLIVCVVVGTKFPDRAS